MPRYKYKAYERDGAVTHGEISASTRGDALEVLARRATYPVELTEAEPGGEAEVKWWQREIGGTGKLSSARLAAFTRELAGLVKANLPLDEALRIVAMQPLIPRRVRQVTNAALGRVLEGAQLSEALAAEPAIPDYYARLIRAGEASGALGGTLDDLASALERAAATQARVGSALIYPAVLVAAAVAVIAVISTVLLPAIVPIFEDAGTEPPLVVRTLAGLGATAVGSWTILVALLAALAVAVAAAVAHPGTRLALDRFWLKVPVVRDLVQRRETGRFSRTFALMLKSGVPMLEALRITGSVLSNRAFRAAALKAADEIKEGGTLSASLERAGLFPDLFLRLNAVGEKTGQLESMHGHVADIYEAALARHIDRLTSLVTPVLTLVIGLVVGVIILSVMNAILSVNELALQ